MFNEIKQINTKSVWMPKTARRLTIAQMKKVIRCSFFMKEKYNLDGTFNKIKGRLVAGGNQQIRLASEDTSSPTAHLQSIFMVAAIAAKENRKVATVDIAGAYLNADIGDEEVLMKLDPLIAMILCKIDGKYTLFLNDDGTMIVQLKKALYGCIQSAMQWYKNIKSTLEHHGFITNPIDPCIFNLEGQNQCTIVLYVDDLMITCKDEEVINKVIIMLENKYKDLTKHFGEHHDYLGCRFDFTKQGKVIITMKKYIEDIIKFYGVNKKATTPATVNILNIDKGIPLSNEHAERFHSAVARLLYLSKRVRPDIQFAVTFLCTRVSAPTDYDEMKLVRILQYLNNDHDIGLTLEMNDKPLVTAFIDAAYGIHADAKGHTGMAITIGKGTVNAKSTKQKLVSKSSSEAELIALSDSTSQVIWTRDFLIHQGYEMGAADIMQDNKSTIMLAEKGRSTSEKTRHINIRYFFVKDRINSKEIQLNYLSTNEMIADILTKPLQGAQFIKMRNILLNYIPMLINSS